MALLAIDPGRSFKGEKTIGYALFQDRDGREIERGALSWEDLVGKLDIRGVDEAIGPWLAFNTYDVYEVVIEDFINNEKSRGGQRNGTSECIGAVEFACIKAGVPFTRQKPSILPVAMRHAGYVQKLKHLPHQDSAYLHGYYYLTAKGALHPKGLTATLGST